MRSRSIPYGGRLLSLLLVLSVLASCAPAQDFVGGAVNQVTGDGAALTPTVQALQFDPQGPVTGVLVDVRGENLVSLDEADNCEGDAQHLQCLLGNVSEPVAVEMTGSGITAVVTYRREGQLRLELLTVPPQ